VKVSKLFHRLGALVNSIEVEQLAHSDEKLKSPMRPPVTNTVGLPKAALMPCASVDMAIYHHCAALHFLLVVRCQPAAYPFRLRSHLRWLTQLAAGLPQRHARLCVSAQGRPRARAATAVQLPEGGPAPPAWPAVPRP
jgi:hypothetical protein